MSRAKRNKKVSPEQAEASEGDANSGKWEFLLEYSKIIYENEEKRERSIIEQAGRMQSAFSFVIAALFVLIPTIIEHSGISLGIIVTAFSSITLFLILSLVLATLAQYRKKRNDFPRISKMVEELAKYPDAYKTKEQKQKYLTETYETIHDNYEDDNTTKQHYLKASMYLFFVAIALCIIWFVVFICMPQKGA